MSFVNNHPSVIAEVFIEFIYLKNSLRKFRVLFYKVNSGESAHRVSNLTSRARGSGNQRERESLDENV